MQEQIEQTPCYLQIKSNYNEAMSILQELKEQQSGAVSD